MLTTKELIRHALEIDADYIFFTENGIVVIKDSTAPSASPSVPWPAPEK